MQYYNPFMHNYWVKWKREFGGGGGTWWKGIVKSDNFLEKHEVSASMLTRTGPKLHRDLSYTCNKTYLTFLAYWPAGKKSQDC